MDYNRFKEFLLYSRNLYKFKSPNIEKAITNYPLHSKIYREYSKRFWQPKRLVVRNWTATIKIIGALL